MQISQKSSSTRIRIKKNGIESLKFAEYAQKSSSTRIRIKNVRPTLFEENHQFSEIKFHQNKD